MEPEKGVSLKVGMGYRVRSIAESDRGFMVPQYENCKIGKNLTTNESFLNAVF